MPRSVAEDMPAVSAVATMSAEQDGVAQLSAAFVVAYDDIASVRYYGTAFRAFWTQKWATIEDAIEAAAAPSEVATVASLTDALNTKLVAELTAVGGDEYATIGALAYRCAASPPCIRMLQQGFEPASCCVLLPLMTPRSTVTDLNPPAC